METAVSFASHSPPLRRAARDYGGLKPTLRRAGARRRWLQLPCLLAHVAWLGGCGGPPPPPPPTVAEVKLVASNDVNPTATGAGAPIAVRIYQLAAGAAFDKAEFFPLLNSDTASLGQDLVKRDDYLLAPGATRQATLSVPDRVQSIGVFANYRQFQVKTWRLDVALPPHKTTAVNISLTAAGLVVGPGP